MARRTKEDSLETRAAIIAAARDVFLANGVTRTSLEQIAAAAGVTRGAIYWHFADKTELFYAMRDAVKLPLVDRSDLALEAGGAGLDPLQRLERFLGVIVDQIVDDEATRKTFEIMTFKCEYVGEFARDFDCASVTHLELRDKLAKLYREARRAGLLRAGLTPLHAASDTLIFMFGLIRVWLVDESGVLVRNDARRLVAGHVEGKRAGRPSETAASAAGRPRRTVSRAAPK